MKPQMSPDFITVTETLLLPVVVEVVFGCLCSTLSTTPAACGAQAWATPPEIPATACQLDDDGQSGDTAETSDSQPLDNPKAVKVTESLFVDLLDGELTELWKHYHADTTVPLSAVWSLIVESTGEQSERVLVCTGHPKGFLYTHQSYTDFELTLQWKFPTDENGNSGVLVYTQDEARIWPTSMQIQFHQPRAGSVFPGGNARSDNKTEKTDLARPVNTWNECRIISRGGRLSVEVNGTNAGETTGAVPSSGSIALQSEGAEVHFRRMKIRRLEPAESNITVRSDHGSDPNCRSVPQAPVSE